jgi:hypothetical protein
MSVMGLFRPTMVTDVPEDGYLVVHPLDDSPEAKVDTSALGPMPMTESVRLSLLALRGYLVVMMLLVLYHVADLAGAFGHHTR